jgi:hypothetical protein
LKAKPLDIAGGYAKAEYSQLNAEETINWYVDIVTDELKRTIKKSLFPTDGLKSIKSIAPSGKGRRIYNKFKDYLFVVVGDGIFTMDTLENFSKVGKIETQSGYVGIADNGKHTIFVDGVSMWFRNNETGEFKKLEGDTIPPNPIGVEVFASRFVVISANSNRVSYSKINDGESWDALDFFLLNDYPDEAISLGVIKGRLLIAGKRAVYIYYDSGRSPLPYQKTGTPLEFGCAAIGSMTSDLGYLIWLSQNSNGVSSIIMSNGSTANAISTQAIDREIGDYESIEDAQSYIYKNKNGYIFYRINFTKDNTSWQFHINSELPLKDRWVKLDYNSSDRHLVQDHGYFNAKHYALDYRNSSLYEISPDYLDDAGVAIRRRRIIGGIEYADPIIFNKFELEGTKGVGTSSGLDKVPEVELSVSYDNGANWSNVVKRSLGVQGKGRWRTIWDKLGYAKSFTFKLDYYHATPITMQKVYMTVGA